MYSDCLSHFGGCNYFSQESKDIFRRRDVVKSFRFHLIHIQLFIKKRDSFISNLNLYNCINVIFLHISLQCVL